MSTRFLNARDLGYTFYVYDYIIIRSKWIDTNLFTPVFQLERCSLGDWAGEAMIQT